jgi:hypothetical protein
LPLKFKGYPGFDWTNKLILWEMPQPGEEYGIGVDLSDGVGKDNSVIEVLRKGTLYQNDAQVAEWARPSSTPTTCRPSRSPSGRCSPRARTR